ncbi:molecular chaperone HtpG [Lachnospiraceae bacterium NK3A20]|nr:molecular chaperone HtpG [Lachnospiraceae bacterium NK3A20]
MAEKGQLSINSENMFPIIKKWLYSDHDIFYRELISNGCDAITKLKKLELMGEISLPEGYKPRIDVVLNPDEKTVTVTDNGLGMTADEVKKYINDIAFSGAEAFMKKYKDKANNDQIIGHFGLGFYSAFMVADLVTIDTLSCQPGATAVHWECDGSSEYTMEDATRGGFGTTVTLHLSDDCVEFSNYYKAKEVIRKYCGFMPTEIYLSVKDTKETETIPAAERRPDDVVIEELEPSDDEKKAAEKDGKEPEKKLKIRKRPELVNDTHPLWEKTPKDCTDEEYKEFYRKLFNDYKEPLFWIHLNMDYPYNLKGILYFPKLNLEYESAEGVIKLYNNQVFIADNIKEVIPEYLMLLKGVIDCPDLPLNVSRSALQNDGFAQKISDYITKKVAEKLAGMCKTDRENYNKYWDDISPFIKYGVLKDDKFAEKMRDYILFKDLDGGYETLPDALKINVSAASEESAATDENGNKVETEEEKPSENSKATSTDGDKKAEEKAEPKNETIYYVTDEQQQGQYIRVFRDHKMQAFILDHNIDAPFIQQLEMKNEGIHFVRIDAGVDEVLKKKSSKKDEEELKKVQPEIEKVVRRALSDDKLKVDVDNLRDKNISSILKVDEQNRRMQDMMKMYAAGGMGSMGDFGREGETLVLNYRHPLVKYVLAHKTTKNTKLICEQLYDMAKIQNAPLSPAEMARFVERTNAVLEVLAGKSLDEVDPSMEEPREKPKDDAGSKEATKAAADESDATQTAEGSESKAE